MINTKEQMLPQEMSFITQPLNYYLFTLKSQVFYESMSVEELIDEAMTSHRAFRYLLLRIIKQKNILEDIKQFNQYVFERICKTFDYFFTDESIGDTFYKNQIKEYLNWYTESVSFSNEGIRKDANDLWKDLTVYRLYCWKEKNRLNI